MGMYEASMLINEYEKNGDGVNLKPEDDNDGDDVTHKVCSNGHRGKFQKSTTRVIHIESSSNMPFSTREQMKEVFLYHDANNDGFLDRRELTKAFAFLGSIIPFYKACYAIVYADANEDGRISDAELDKLIDYATKTIKIKK